MVLTASITLPLLLIDLGLMLGLLARIPPLPFLSIPALRLLALRGSLLGPSTFCFFALTLFRLGSTLCLGFLCCEPFSLALLGGETLGSGQNALEGEIEPAACTPA